MRSILKFGRLAAIDHVSAVGLKLYILKMEHLVRHSIAVLLLFSAASITNAKPEQLAGQFTHDFTSPANKPVWTVTKSEAEWQVFVNGANKKLSAKEASELERRDFWEQMWWPPEKAVGAKCLRFGGEWPGMICYAPASVRAGIEDLAKKKIDYFYFDSMMGLREIRLKDK